MAIKPTRDRQGDRGEHRWAGRDVFTTGEAAEICNVSQQTIIRCFDNGRLTGFRVPGSRFRRIPRADLLRFMKLNSIPLSSLNGTHRRVLVISADVDFTDALMRAAATEERLDVQVVTTAFDAGVLTQQIAPRLIVVDADVAQLDPRAVLRRAVGDGERDDACVVVVGDALRGDSIEQYTGLGAALCVRKPVDASALARRIGELVS